ncbi:MAG: PqqD family protein [Gammaproteobacteria bacterium]|nr:PqqD family protein [Gammaproteobacteria bacterium]MCP5424610.1 PqqD family protein [Gammaproteobacteria bacterium]
MKLADKVTIPANVMARQVDEETVILDLRGGAYYGLNDIGTRVWQLLIEGKTPMEVCDSMMEEFDVSREELEKDVLTLLNELECSQLIFRA